MKRFYTSIIVVITLYYAWGVIKISRKNLPRSIPMRTHSFLSLDNQTTRALIRSISARIPFLNNCLVRAIATAIILRLSNRSVEIVFGVRNSSEFEAHAWVRDKRGEILMGDTPDRTSYKELLTNKEALA